jgi:hypothetical protein
MAFLTITVLPAKSALVRLKDASRDVARVVSDVSVLCPRLVAQSDNGRPHPVRPDPLWHSFSAAVVCGSRADR